MPSTAPTGYPMKAEVWVRSASLLTPVKFALGLPAGRVRGVMLDAVLLAGRMAATDCALMLSIEEETTTTDSPDHE